MLGVCFDKLRASLATPQGMRSMPNPIFSSMMPFSGTSPRWRCQIMVASVDSMRLLAIT